MSDYFVDIEIRGAKSLHQYEELAKIFLQPSEHRVHGPEDTEGQKYVDHHRRDLIELSYDVTEDESASKFEDRYKESRRLYEDLSRITGKRPKWGVLTGIRPVKLAGEVIDGIYGDVLEKGDKEEEDSSLEYFLKDRYLIAPEKAALTCEILKFQDEVAKEAEEGSFSMYIGIPFCPTRCLYCSFTSNRADDDEMDRYVEALIKEMDFCAGACSVRGILPESIYMGGGTPTALTCEQLDRVISRVIGSFDLKDLREFTVEAGRPDTITEDKLKILIKYGITGISINPQSMKQETLDIIGRKHSVEDTLIAFERARKTGIRSINMDLIAGLPNETPEDFENSLDEVMDLGPEKITLHTLAVKRASRLKERDENFSYRDEELREEMLDQAHKKLRRKGYRPYYMYRQKYTSGNTENTGWCRGRDAGIYNIRIMDEHQSILALGAGGISKRYFPRENRLERIPNVSNYEIYIDRIDDMIDRKRKEFFLEKGE